MSVGDEPIPLTATGGTGTYVWSSSDDGIASVDENGKVTALSAGQATLTVTDGTGKGTCTVIVKAGSDTSAAGGSSGHHQRDLEGRRCGGSQRRGRRVCALRSRHQL